MLELGIGADLVRGVGWVLWGLLAIALAFALLKPKTPGRKAFWVAVVLGVFIAPLSPGMWAQYQYKKRYAVAKAMFDEVCKTAGEKIYKTVEGVEGITLLNVRDWKSGDENNPYAADAAGARFGSKSFIESFLRWEAPHQAGRRGGLPGFAPVPDGSPPFRWVDVRQTDGTFIRYGAPMKDGWPTGELLKGQPSRYAVSFTNDLTPALRDQWIAGTVVTITDTTTKEVLATRTHFKFERGFGSNAGFRQPWAFAVHCDPEKHFDGERYFVDQVLKPKEYQP